MPCSLAHRVTQVLANFCSQPPLLTPGWPCVPGVRQAWLLVFPWCIMSPGKLLEQAQGAETGEGEVSCLLMFSGSYPRTLTHTIPVLLSVSHCPTQCVGQCSTSLEGVRGAKSSTWRKKELPGAGFEGPLCG